MDGFTTLFTYAAALAIAAAIPGPGIAALVGQVLGSGLRAGLFFLAGLALGDVIYLTIAVAGLAALAKTFAGAFLGVKVLGGLYLIYLAWRFWTSETGMIKPEGVRRSSDLKAFLAGLTVTLGNPKTIIFYMALLPTVVNLRTVGFPLWCELTVVTVLVLFAVLTPYAVLATKARGMMKSSKALSRINRAAAAIIGTAGILILGQAARSLARRA